MSHRSGAATLVVAVALLGVSCSGGGAARPPTALGTNLSAPSTTATANASTPTTSTSTPTSTGTPVTQPPGTDPGAVKPILESLVDRYDVAVAAVLTDPRVAAVPGSPVVADYLALFSSGSTIPQTALQFWADEGAQGHFYRPGPRGRMYESTVQGLQTDSPDQVTFVVCSLKSIVIVDSSGKELSAEGGKSAGSVVAVRVEGTWVLRDLTRTSAADCPDPPAQP